MKILLLAALPQEYAPLRKIVPEWRILEKNPNKRIGIRLHDKEIILVETGMGPRAVTAAVKNSLSVLQPDLIVFAGFAGGLHPALSVGDVCVAGDAGSPESGTSLVFSFPPELGDFFSENSVTMVSAFTALRPESKRDLSALAGGPAVLDMETEIVAGISAEAGIPFICFRSVSDAINDELGFDLGDISGADGKVRIGKVLKTIVKRPATVEAFYCSWRRSSHAARNLCRVLSAFFEIPAGQLSSAASKIVSNRSAE